MARQLPKTVVPEMRSPNPIESKIQSSPHRNNTSNLLLLPEHLSSGLVATLQYYATKQFLGVRLVQSGPVKGEREGSNRHPAKMADRFPSLDDFDAGENLNTPPN